MPYSVEIIRKLEKIEPPLKDVLIDILAEIELQRKQWEESVTKKEFNELKEIVAELAKAQKKTEQRIGELTEAQKKTEQRLNELVEAQKKTEHRVDKLEIAVQELAEAQKRTEQRVNELAEAQKKTEQRLNELIEAQKRIEHRVDKLEIAVQELAEAQKRTEQRVDKLEITVQELAEAQRKTEQRVNELAEAQKKTEQEIAKLTRELQGVKKQVGGLSRSVGYALENEAFRHLPSFLKRRYNIEVIDSLIRTYVGEEEINVFGKAKKDDKEFYIVGEAVLKLDDRSKLKKLWDKVSVVREEFGEDVIPIIVTHFAKPDILERANKAGIIVVQSFEWI